MPDIANYLAQNRPSFDRLSIDREIYGNKLARNQVARIPQQNRAEDLALQAGELEIGNAQRQNAAGVLGRNFTIAANSPRPREAMRAFLASPDFVAAGKIVGLPVEQFTITDADTDDSIRQQAVAWAQALGAPSASSAEDPTKVREYQQARQDGYQGSFTDYLKEFYGREISEPANVKSAKYYAGLDQEGRRLYNEANRSPQIENIGGVPNRIVGGNAPQPLSSLDTEANAKQRMAQATAQGTATGELTGGGMKNVRLQAAVRRLERVKQASEALGFGGPVIGNLAGATPSGQELNQANAQLMTELTALTRVPGVGSQSDLEQRLAQLQLPTSNMYGTVRANAIKELEAFMRDLEAAFNNLGGQAPSNGMPDFSSMSDDDLMRIINGP